MYGVVGRVAMRDPSELLAHEAAFALGQMRDAEAIPALRTVLEDVAAVPSIVRHEVIFRFDSICSEYFYLSAFFVR